MLMTLDEFKTALPAKLKRTVSKDTLDHVNQVLNEPEMYEFYRNNFIDYSHVLATGRNSVEEYVNAIKYCSFKIAGYSNKDSYIKTFPARYKQHMANGVNEKDLASYISAYNKTKLVSAILEQAYIPTWLLNQDAVQEAINTQVALMRTAESEKVKSDAANSLLNHLKPPEKSKIELDIGVKQDVNQIEQLRNAIKDLTEAQKQSITSGVKTVSKVAESKIIEHQED